MSYREHDVEVLFADPPHTHPLARWLRLVLLTFGVCFAIAYLSILALFLQGQHRDARESSLNAQATYKQCVERRENAATSVVIWQSFLVRLRPDTDPAIREIGQSALQMSERTTQIACPHPS